jgi:hypothetical protein
MKLFHFLPAILVCLGVALSGSAQAADAASEVREIAAKLRGSKAELEKLKPTAAQIGQIAATPADAEKLQAYTEKLFAQIPAAGLDGKPDQTEIVVTQGDSLPGGYKSNAAHFKAGLAVYGFKYVKPGETSGMAFDGLVKVDGAWVMIPKMWRAF